MLQDAHSAELINPSANDHRLWLNYLFDRHFTIDDFMLLVGCCFDM